MDQSVRIVIERMKTAKRIRIEFDDMEVQPIHNDKLLAHDIAMAFQAAYARHEARVHAAMISKTRESIKKIEQEIAL